MPKQHPFGHGEHYDDHHAHSSKRAEPLAKDLRIRRHQEIGENREPNKSDRYGDDLEQKPGRLHVPILQKHCGKARVDVRHCQCSQATQSSTADLRHQSLTGDAGRQSVPRWLARHCPLDQQLEIIGSCPPAQRFPEIDLFV